jgi:hypothetical protein
MFRRREGQDDNEKRKPLHPRLTIARFGFSDTKPSEAEASDGAETSEATTFPDAFRRGWEAANEKRYDDAITQYT